MNRLVLTEDQSAFIRESGIKFAVVHPGSYPANVGRYVLDLIPCDCQRAVDAVAVATGEARANRPRVKAPAIATDALEGHPMAKAGAWLDRDNE
jgi:hypothetical protein